MSRELQDRYQELLDEVLDQLPKEYPGLQAKIAEVERLRRELIRRELGYKPDPQFDQKTPMSHFKHFINAVKWAMTFAFIGVFLGIGLVLGVRLIETIQ